MALDPDVLKNTILYGVNGSAGSPAADSLFRNIINTIHKPPLDSSRNAGDMDQEDYNEAIDALETFYEALAQVIAEQVVTHIKSYAEIDNSSYLSIANTGGSENNPLENIK